MKKRLLAFIGALCVIFLFLIIKRINSQNKQLEEFRKTEINGIINFIDESRGTIIGLYQSDHRYRIAGNLIKTNSNNFNYPFYRFGDSIYKKSLNDTFTIFRKKEFFIYLIPR